MSDLAVTIRDGRVEQKGKLHKGVWIPFSIEATVAPDERPDPPASGRASRGRDSSGEDDELLRTRAATTSIKVRTGRGVTVRDNDLLLEPSHMMPAPESAGQGHVGAGRRRSSAPGDGRTACRTEAARRADSDAANYIWFHGSRIRFGRLTMTDAGPAADRCRRAGPVRLLFSSIQRAGRGRLFAQHAKRGLRAVLPDYDDISRLPIGRLPDPAARPVELRD